VRREEKREGEGEEKDEKRREMFTNKKRIKRLD
jgi:hypothetical protein